MESKAILRGARLSAQKGRLLADLIRGKKIEQALDILNFSMRKKGALILKKLLESALANAENNYGMDVDELMVKEILVEKGLVLKRFSARAKGRGDRISKQCSNLYIVLSQV